VPLYTTKDFYQFNKIPSHTTKYNNNVKRKKTNLPKENEEVRGVEKVGGGGHLLRIERGRTTCCAGGGGSGSSSDDESAFFGLRARPPPPPPAVVVVVDVDVVEDDGA
jgi:hypothetical protein